MCLCAAQWYEWRHQIEHFAATHRCLAIDLRGFGYSEVAGNKEDPSLYTSVHQCRDIAALLDAEKVERVLIVGHDWGGAIVWHFARRYPHRLHGVASCTFYRPRNQPPPLLTLLRVLPHFSYMLVFSYARLQTALNFEGDVDRALNFIIRGQHESLGLVKAISSLSLLTFLPLTAPRSKLWSAAELRAQADMFRYSGFRYALLLYSTLRLSARQAMKSEAALGLPPVGSSPQPPGPTNERIAVPALMMPAEGDAILQPVLCDGMEGWCDELTRVDIRDAGHWAQLEQPAQVNAALTSFIERLRLRKRDKGA